MKFTLAATVAALAATTAADFVVVTALPTPTNLGVLLNVSPLPAQTTTLQTPPPPL